MKIKINLNKLEKLEKLYRFILTADTSNKAYYYHALADYDKLKTELKTSALLVESERKK